MCFSSKAQSIIQTVDLLNENTKKSDDAGVAQTNRMLVFFLFFHLCIDRTAEYTFLFSMFLDFY